MPVGWSDWDIAPDSSDTFTWAGLAQYRLQSLVTPTYVDKGYRQHIVHHSCHVATPLNTSSHFWEHFGRLVSVLPVSVTMVTLKLRNPSMHACMHTLRRRRRCSMEQVHTQDVGKTCCLNIILNFFCHTKFRTVNGWQLYTCHKSLFIQHFIVLVV